MRLAGLHLLWLASCTALRATPLPAPDEAVRSIVVIFDGAELAVRAYSAELAPREIETAADLRAMTVLHYTRSLEELGLAAGEVAIATDRDCASIPAAGWSASFSGAPGDALSPSEPNQAIASLRFAVPCPCVTFEATPVDLGTEPVRSLIPYDERRVLLVTPPGFLLVDAAAQAETIATPLPMWASFEDQQGRFWFGDILGQLWFGDPLGALTQTFSSSAALDVVAIDGHVRPDRFELLVVTKDRWLLRFDGAAWDLLYQQENLSDDQDGQIVFLRPGRAVVTLPDGDGLLQYDDSRVIPVEVEEWNPAERGHLLALELVDGFGLLLATRTGRHFFRAEEDGPLEELADPVEIQDRAPVFDLMPFRGGFVEVGFRGHLRQWHPTSGFCAPTNLDFQVDLHQIAPLGDRLVVAGSARQNGRNRGFVLRVLEP